MKKKIEYIIVDDEASAIEDLKNELSLMDIDGISFQCLSSFETPIDFRKALKDIALDNVLLFLDYQMPGCSGVELAKLIEDTEANMIFVSGKQPSPEEIFECSAIDFVSKPVRPARLKKALKKGLEKLNYKSPNNSKMKVCLHTRDYYKSDFNIDEIVLIESDGKNQTLYFEHKKPVALCCDSLRKIADELTGTSCIQVGKGHIVNAEKVSKMRSKDSILLYLTRGDGKEVETEITIGNPFKDAFFMAKPHFRK